ncbi:hypothetical protein BGZ61DRAFT_442567 [Ilyonectria robusta]|uniref:uncharacterized protein n=1 Tax=Ilyonectria robusta TaxID=1079257 RepID=UPI001E8D61FA|nr:uncharacterized protein BGZ61DRAFT_442567 [Ilyonectria robusta]KAH8734449.1 hypothetical protein BGZ61DRAFT_442567 [Ilyonectria robusta]
MKPATASPLLLWMAFGCRPAVAHAPSFSVKPNPGASALYASAFGDAGLLEGDIDILIGNLSSGTFINGPLGMERGVILTTGDPIEAILGGDINVDAGRMPSGEYPGYDTISVVANIVVPESIEALKISYIFATAEPPPFADELRRRKRELVPRHMKDDQMVIRFDGEIIERAYASDLRLTSSSNNIGMSYARSTRLLSRNIPMSPGIHSFMFTVYEVGDALRDSALLFSVKAVRRPESTSLADTTDADAIKSPISTALDPNISSGMRPVSNLPTIGQYTFGGCLLSEAGYPTFAEVGRGNVGNKMEPALCLSLAKGSKYFGINDDICYAADSINQTRIVPSQRCNWRCPGNLGRFCGGLGRLRGWRNGGTRRVDPLAKLDIASLLLTLYIHDEDSTTSLIANEKMASDIGAEPVSAAPKTVLTSITSVVRYTTVEPTHSRSLIIVEIRTTLEFYYCAMCRTAIPPIVEMTKKEVPCNGCGRGGENSILLTVPVEALAQATSLYGSLIRTVEETRADPVASSVPAESVYGGIILPQKTNAEMEVIEEI